MAPCIFHTIDNGLRPVYSIYIDVSSSKSCIYENCGGLHKKEITARSYHSS